MLRFDLKEQISFLIASTKKYKSLKQTEKLSKAFFKNLFTCLAQPKSLLSSHKNNSKTIPWIPLFNPTVSMDVFLIFYRWPFYFLNTVCLRIPTFLLNLLKIDNIATFSAVIYPYLSLLEAMQLLLNLFKVNNGHT